MANTIITESSLTALPPVRAREPTKIADPLANHEWRFYAPRFENCHSKLNAQNPYGPWYQIQSIAAPTSNSAQTTAQSTILDFKLVHMTSQLEAMTASQHAQTCIRPFDEIDGKGVPKFRGTYATEHVFELQTLGSFMFHVHREATRDISEPLASLDDKMSQLRMQEDTWLKTKRDLANLFLREGPDHPLLTNEKLKAVIQRSYGTKKDLSVIHFLAMCLPSERNKTGQDLKDSDFVYLNAKVNGMKAVMFGEKTSEMSSQSKMLYILMVAQYLRMPPVRERYQRVSKRMRRMVAKFARYCQDLNPASPWYLSATEKDAWSDFYDEWELSYLEDVRTNASIMLRNGLEKYRPFDDNPDLRHGTWELCEADKDVLEDWNQQLDESILKLYFDRHSDINDTGVGEAESVDLADDGISKELKLRGSLDRLPDGTEKMTPRIEYSDGGIEFDPGYDDMDID